MTEFNLQDIIIEYSTLLEDDEKFPSPKTVFEIYNKRPANERTIVKFPRLVGVLQKIAKDCTAFKALSLEEKERYLVSAYFSQ